jgi:hypothetical protein
MSASGETWGAGTQRVETRRLYELPNALKALVMADIPGGAQPVEAQDVTPEAMTYGSAPMHALPTAKFRPAQRPRGTETDQSTENRATERRAMGTKTQPPENRRRS